MSVVADDRADVVSAAGVPGPPADSFVEALVARLHDEYGVPRDELREEVEAALSAFTSARLRTFVPILVEKRLRNAYRVHRT